MCGGGAGACRCVRRLPGCIFVVVVVGGEGVQGEVGGLSGPTEQRRQGVSPKTIDEEGGLFMYLVMTV